MKRVVVEHFSEEVDLFDSDAVLACDTSAEGKAFFHDLMAGGDDAVDLVGVAVVEKENRMQVAITGVKYIGDPKTCFVRGFGDEFEHFGKLRSRDDAIVSYHAWRQPSDCADAFF